MANDKKKIEHVLMLRKIRTGIPLAPAGPGGPEGPCAP